MSLSFLIGKININIYDAIYERDEAGRVKSKTEIIGTETIETTYKYDVNNRIKYEKVVRDGVPKTIHPTITQ